MQEQPQSKLKKEHAEVSQNFGVFTPLIYIVSGILSTCLGVLISKDSIGFYSPITWIFLICLVSFIFFYGYVLIKRPDLLLKEANRMEILKQQQRYEYQKNRSRKPIDFQKIGFKPVKNNNPDL